MFKPRQQARGRRNQPQQNPISDMEQFYLHQYFGQGANRQMPPPIQHPHTAPSAPMQQIDLAKLHQLELRIARIEEYLGFGSPQTSSDFSIR